MDFDLLSGLFSSILQAVSITYILSTNLLIYFIIQGIDQLNRRQIVSKTTKKIITAISAAVLFAIFHFAKLANLDVLITSLLIVPISYKYFIKFILKTFGISYKEQEL